MRKRHQWNKKGFTLAELLAVVAIMSILAGFGFIEVVQHQRALKLTEMDNTAREIFLAAQNHLTEQESTGEWGKLYKEHNQSEDTYLGTSLTKDTWTPADKDSSISEEDFWNTQKHDWRAITYAPGTSENSLLDSTNSALGAMLPFGSTDETVRNGGYYVIEYDALNAAVYGVFYTDNSAGVDTEDIAAFDANQNGRAEGSAFRRDYHKTLSNGDSVRDIIGYYGGAVADTVSYNSTTTDTTKYTLQDIAVEFVNAERLLLVVTDPNPAALNTQYLTQLTNNKFSDGYQYTFTITITDTDATGSNVEPVTLTTATINGSMKSGSSVSYTTKPDATNGNDQIIFVLDSVTDDKKHFKQLFPTIVPGDNIKASVTATVTWGDQKKTVSSDSSQVTYADGRTEQRPTTNSLFGDNSTSTAVKVENARHLENLSVNISGYKQKTGDETPTDFTAQITKNIDWNSFLEGLKTQKSNYGLNTASSTITFLNDQEKAVKNTYYGIVNPYLQGLAGNVGDSNQSATLSNFAIEQEENTSVRSSGLIAEATRTLNISNLELDKFTVAQNRKNPDAGESGSKNVNAAALIGFFSGDSANDALGVSGVTVSNTTVGTETTGCTTMNSALVLGAINKGTATISNCTVDGKNTVNGQMAGAVLGRALNTKDKKSTLYSGDTVTMPSVTISSCNIDGARLTVHGRQYAGGVVGEYSLLEAGKEHRKGVTCQISSVTVDVQNLTIETSSIGGNKEKAYAAGGLVGDITDSANMTISGCTVSSGDIQISNTNSNADGVELQGAGGAVGMIHSSTEATVNDAQLTNLNLSGINVGKNTGKLTVSSQGVKGNAGGLVGCIYASASTPLTGTSGYPVNISNSSVIAQKVTIAATQYAGGEIGYCEDTKLSVSKTNIGDASATVTIASTTSDSGAEGGNVSYPKISGGFIGYLKSDKDDIGNNSDAGAQFTNCTVQSSDLTVHGSSNAGGFVGQDDKVIIGISGCIVNGGAAGSVTAEQNNAGGFFGKISTKSSIGQIANSYATVLVRLAGTSANGTAGGFGGIADHLNITSCYASGRTSNGKYEGDSYDRNVYAAGTESYAGGFIGNADEKTAINSCYTTCSVKSGATSNDSATGGFVGNIDKGASVTNSYSTGLVSAAQGSTGAFAGISNLTNDSTGNYCLDGVPGNVSVVVGKTAKKDKTIATLADITSTEAPFNTSNNSAEATPFDNGLTDKKYGFKTLSGLNSSCTINTHVGDWPVVTAVIHDDTTNITAVNGNKLSIHITVPQGTEYFSLAVEGLASVNNSTRVAYAPFKIYNYGAADQAIDWISFSKVANNTLWKFDKDVATSLWKECGIAHLETADIYKTQTGKDAPDDSICIRIDLDDLSVKNLTEAGSFNSLFNGILFPGEDIRVYAVDRFEKIDVDDKTIPSTVTNSIFADGSNWTSNDYKDENGVVTTAKNTALIANSRHLLNLNKKISGVNKENVYFSAATQIDNIHWLNDENTIKESGTKAYVSELKTLNNTDAISTYIFDNDKIPAKNNSFCPIDNSDLISYDGQNHTIENVQINVQDLNGPVDTAPAAIFYTVSNGFTAKNLQLHNITLNTQGKGDSQIALLVSYGTNLTFHNIEISGTCSLTDTNDITQNGFGGALAGVTSGNLTVDNCSISGSLSITAAQAGGLIGFYSGLNGDNVASFNNCQISPNTFIVTATNGNGGGFIGSTNSGKIEIKNSKITSDNGTINAIRNAGGLIGDISGASSFATNNVILTGNNFNVSNSSNGQNSYGACAGGLVGNLNSSFVDINQTAVSVYVNEVADGGSAGGLIGTLNTSGTISNTYVGGHTTEGKYPTDKGNVNANYSGSNSVYVGGFIGSCTKKGPLTISECFTTASANSNGNGQGSYVGGFIGNVGSGSLTVEKCYSTGLVTVNSKSDSKAGSFIGDAGWNYASLDNCNVLAGINSSDVKPIAADGQRIWGKVGILTATNSTSSDNTYPFDTVLQSKAYPYSNTVRADGVKDTTLLETATDLTQNKNVAFYGDWPQPASNVGLLYYEKLDDGSEYYKGYLAANVDNLVDYRAQGSALPSDTGKFVVDDHYYLAVNTKESANLSIRLGSVKNGLKGASKALALSDIQKAETKVIGGTEYDLYAINKDTFNNASVYYNPANNGADLFVLNNGSTIASFGYLPFFADTVTVPEESDPTRPAAVQKQFEDASNANGYVVRSANQMIQLANLTSDQRNNPYLVGSYSNDIVIEQQLDISFKDNTLSEALYKNLGKKGKVTFTSQEAQDKSRHYLISEVNATLFDNVNNRGSVKHLTLINSNIVGNNEIYNGIVNNNYGFIYDCTLNNCFTSGNGFVGENLNGGKIGGCNLINCRTQESGFAGYNNGELVDCHVYSDVKNEGEQTGKYGYTVVGLNADETKLANSTDDSIASKQDSYEYANPKDWSKRNGLNYRYPQDGQEAGFVTYNDYLGQIDGCSFTGSVYGSNMVGGFYVFNVGDIADSYSNSYIYCVISDDNSSSMAGGFGVITVTIPTKRSDYSNISYYSTHYHCHSSGEFKIVKETELTKEKELSVETNDSNISEAGFVNTIENSQTDSVASIQYCYEAMWKMQTSTNDDSFINDIKNVDLQSGKSIENYIFENATLNANGIKESKYMSYGQNASALIAHKNASDLCSGNNLGIKATNSKPYNESDFTYSEANDPFPMPHKFTMDESGTYEPELYYTDDSYVITHADDNKPMNSWGDWYAESTTPTETAEVRILMVGDDVTNKTNLPGVVGESVKLASQITPETLNDNFLTFWTNF